MKQSSKYRTFSRMRSSECRVWAEYLLRLPAPSRICSFDTMAHSLPLCASTSKTSRNLDCYLYFASHSHMSRFLSAGKTPLKYMRSLWTERVMLWVFPSHMPLLAAAKQIMTFQRRKTLWRAELKTGGTMTCLTLFSTGHLIYGYLDASGQEGGPIEVL